MAFKDRLKEARLAKGLTQEALAKEIGVAKSTVTGYEKGNSEPDISKIIKIIKILKIDANYLWQDEMRELKTEQKSPAIVETTAGDKSGIYKIMSEEKELIYLLYDFAVRSGYVREGDDFSERQEDCIASLVTLFKLVFAEEQGRSVG